MKYLCAFLLLAPAVAACGGQTGPIPALWVGPRLQPTPAEFADVYFVPVRANGSSPALALVDTGAPFSLFNGDAFKPVVPSGVSQVTALSIGDVTLYRVTVLSQSGTPTALPEGTLAGILGHSAYGPLRLSFDPREQQLGIGDVPIPKGADAAGVVQSFTLRGGASVEFGPETGGAAVAPPQTFSFPASRILLQVEIEGRSLRLLLDTGASSVTLRQTIFNEIISDGRATLQSDVATVANMGTATVARLATVTALGQTVNDIVALESQTIEPNLDAIESEAGGTVDGLLGNSFLRQFFTVVDFPKGRLELHRFEDTSYVLDDFHRVGFSIQRVDGKVEVDQVYPGSDASKQGVSPGAELIAIDGTPVSKLGPIRAEFALRGTVGTTRDVTFDTGVRTLAVEEILPPPPAPPGP